MSPHWRWYLPGYLMALPHTIFGLLLALVYRAHSFRWHAGVLCCIGGTFDQGGHSETRIWGRPGAQTHGWLVIAASEEELARADLRVHEYTHVVQGFVLGPLFMLFYVLAFAVPFVKQGFRDWHAAYGKNPFELMAYRVGDAGHGWGE